LRTKLNISIESLSSVLQNSCPLIIPSIFCSGGHNYQTEVNNDRPWLAHLKTVWSSKWSKESCSLHHITICHKPLDLRKMHEIIVLSKALIDNSPCCLLPLNLEFHRAFDKTACVHKNLFLLIKILKRLSNNARIWGVQYQEYTEMHTQLTCMLAEMQSKRSVFIVHTHLSLAPAFGGRRARPQTQSYI